MHYFHSPYTGELIQIEQLQNGNVSGWKPKHQRSGYKGHPKGYFGKKTSESKI